MLHYRSANNVTFPHHCRSCLSGYSPYPCSQEKATTFLQTQRQYLLSVGEKKFYDALIAALDSTRYIIFAKVRIADIIETNLDRADPMYWKKLAPINQKHIDFLLVSRSDTTPLLAIELDGGSHTDKARLKRDAFVDSVFHNAGIPILHIPVKGFYQYNDLRSEIETTITKTSDFRKNVL
jgi:very-short-patch-repair endonuclease